MKSLHSTCLPIAFLATFSLTLLSTSVLAATRADSDGLEKQNAREIFNRAFGGNAVEGQECNKPVSRAGGRITEVFDHDLGKPVFEFFSHVKDDKDCATDAEDRVRVEVKGYNKSVDDLKARQGQRSVYSWAFRMEEGFLPTKKFTHLFQLKAFGGSDAGAPLITLTPRKKGSGNEMQLVYRDSTASKNVILASAPLNQFAGQWIDAKIQVKHSDKGSLRVQLRNKESGELLLNHRSRKIDMYRDSAEFNRPKWGIYRSTLFANDMRNEAVRFTEFCIANDGDKC